MNIHGMSRRPRSRSGSMISAAVAAFSVMVLSAAATLSGQSALKTMQGKWSGVFISMTEVGIMGNPCGNGTLWWDIVGSDLHGKAAVKDQPEFDVTAIVSETGAIEGGFAVAAENVAMFRGTISEGELSGEFETVKQCRGTWTAVKQ